jgi:hypothetical protein
MTSLILNPGTRWSFTSPSVHLSGKDAIVSIGQEAGRALEPVWR